jgi:hypothetical protein
MNKFQKLAQINRDIELLENAGKFQAAEVLQRKFIKEAQTDPFMGLSEIAKKYMMQLDQAYNQKKPVEPILNIAYNDDAVTQNDKNILAGHADKIKDQYSSSIVQNVSNYPGYQTPQGTTVPANNEAYAGQNDAYTMATPATSNIVPQEAYAGQNNAYTMATPPTNNAAPAAQQQTSPAYSDTANQMQAQNTLPGDAEPRLYQSSIQMIANLLNTKMPENRTKAQQIYENTIGQFTNEKRKQAFARQFQAIVTRNFPAGSIK